jgi:uncharacterized protein with HEPN domain
MSGDPLRVIDYLEHIVEAITNIDEYTSGMAITGYLADKKTQDAVIRNFEVIGEACNNVARHHPQFAASHMDVPWNFAYEMRNATDTSRSITTLFGRPSKMICRE